MAVYEGEWYVAEKELHQDGLDKGYTRLTYMEQVAKGKNIFLWPHKKDVVVTFNEDILVKGVSIEPGNNRGHFAVQKKIFRECSA